MNKDPYSVLGIEHDCPAEEIGKKFAELCAELKPLAETDESAAERLNEIISAYNEIIGGKPGGESKQEEKKIDLGVKIAFIIIAIACAAVLTIILSKGKGAKDAEPATEPVLTEESETAAAIEIKSIDYEALRASHKPEEIVLSIGDEQIDWDEYYSWLSMSASQVENYMMSMAMYGAEITWDSEATEEYSFKEYIPISAENSIAQLIAIEKNAEKNGFVKDKEFEELLAQQKLSDMKTVAGEETTEEQFYEMLYTNNMSRRCYERMASANAVYDAAFNFLYGAGSGNIKDEDVVKYLEDKGYMYASHILLMTMDDTMQPLDENAKAEVKAKAEGIYTELAALKNDKDKLVERFKELKELYCEDTGKTMFPDGYVFTGGVMVQGFEDAVKALGDYELSEIVETEYGYHIILRLPLTADTVIDVLENGTSYDGRVLYADELYTGGIKSELKALEIKYADGFTAPDVSQFLKSE